MCIVHLFLRFVIDNKSVNHKEYKISRLILILLSQKRYFCLKNDKTKVKLIYLAEERKSHSKLLFLLE